MLWGPAKTFDFSDCPLFSSFWKKEMINANHSYSCSITKPHKQQIPRELTLRDSDAHIHTSVTTSKGVSLRCAH